MRLVRTLESSGDFKAAIPIIEQVIERFEAQGNSWPLPFEKIALGMLLLAIGQEEASRQHFGQAARMLDEKIKADDQLYSVSSDRCLFIKASVYEGGEVDASRLMQLGEEAVAKEENWWTLACLGLALEQADRVDDAIQYYEEALHCYEISPTTGYSNHKWIHERLFQLYADTDQVERGMQKLPEFVARRDQQFYRLHPDTSLFRLDAARWLAGFEAGHELADGLLAEARERLQYHPDVLRRLNEDIERLEAQLETPGS